MEKGPDQMEEDRLLETARSEARSFPGLVPPNNAVLIGAVDTGDDTYFYYQDDEGNFYYDSERMRRFETEMQERKKARDRQRWRQKKRAV